MRQVVLDTETTGLEPREGHRIIEIGCLEIINKRKFGKSFHVYINPEREIDAGAEAVHGISQASLSDKPKFAEISEEFIAFIAGAPLIIHNAAFDVGFINAEFKRLRGAVEPVEQLCPVIDTLALARQLHPGQRNSLDALCKRYHVDNSNRELHGALLDAELLAQVYLGMLGSGQNNLFEEAASQDGAAQASEHASLAREFSGMACSVFMASSAELTQHQVMLERVEKASDGDLAWRDSESF